MRKPCASLGQTVVVRRVLLCPNHAPKREPNMGQWLYLGASDSQPKLR